MAGIFSNSFTRRAARFSRSLSEGDCFTRSSLKPPYGLFVAPKAVKSGTKPNALFVASMTCMADRLFRRRNCSRISLGMCRTRIGLLWCTCGR
jgi:hypothetical protein